MAANSSQGSSPSRRGTRHRRDHRPAVRPRSRRRTRRRPGRHDGGVAVSRFSSPVRTLHRCERLPHDHEVGHGPGGGHQFTAALLHERPTVVDRGTGRVPMCQTGVHESALCLAGASCRAISRRRRDLDRQRHPALLLGPSACRRRSMAISHGGWRSAGARSGHPGLDGTAAPHRPGGIGVATNRGQLS